MKRILCDNCEGTGREYPYGERSMKCHHCVNGCVAPEMAHFDGQTVSTIFGFGVVHHWRKLVWIIENEDWMIINPRVEDIHV